MDQEKTDNLKKYDYDLIIIGGGSGGISMGNEASKLGAKVCLFDYVEPSPHGSTWGLGGTCVNVGCIPKKLMHQAALLGENYKDMNKFGWSNTNKLTNNWETLRDNIKNYISSINWQTRSTLRSNKVTYLNAFAKFKDPHTLQYQKKNDKTIKTITANKITIAIGGRPKLPDIEGKELGITSDDIFRLESEPGKTLVVGGSYVALECAGFLSGLGYDTTVMMRSIPLRGFDSDMAEKVVSNMDDCHFIRGTVPTKLQKNENGKIIVTFKKDGKDNKETFDTVLFAIGRKIDSDKLNLSLLKTNPNNGKIIADCNHKTNIDNVYVIGDAVENSLELTTIAIKEGKNLANYLYGNLKEITLLLSSSVPSTVFTPLEYGFVGLTDELAYQLFDRDNIEIFHTYFTPLEWKIPQRKENRCYCKILVEKKTDKIIGLHLLSPNAGEIVSGFALSINLGLTRTQLMDNLGIHPTIAEELFKLEVSVSSGLEAKQSGC